MSWNKEADPDKSPDALRLSSMLVEGIANHAVNLEVPNCDEFQESIRKLRQQLERAASPAEGLAAAGQTVKLLEVHNREVERNAKLRLRELSAVISMLIKTVVKLGGAGESWSNNVKTLAADLDNTYKIEDLRLIRDKVSASLRDLSEQNLLHRDAASIRSLAAEGTIKILVADDDPAIAALVTAVLHNHKMVCFVAKDGPETLEMAARLTPNLLLLDVNMPVHDGFETLTMLKRTPSRALFPRFC
jgi:Chemotaxis response regulator containing a CheY-like receiver domain and a methylesterase domain